MTRLLFTITLLLSASFLQAQVAKGSELFQTLKKQDSLLFEKGFNLCDMEYLESVVHKDIIFYHDKSGIQNRTVFFENVKKYICGGSAQKPIRKVKVESLVVYPMYNNNVLYAAVQHGTHNFYLREAGKPDRLTNTAKFTHLYLLENGKWMLKEVLSYDHQEPK